MAFITRPTTVYKDSFLRALEEDTDRPPIDLEEVGKNFERFVQDLNALSEKDENNDRIPESMFWLIEDNAYIGIITIRHYLTENTRKVGGHIGYGIVPERRKEGYGKLILKLALEECRKMGMDSVLITCSPDNIGSKKIIEYNGGILEDEIESTVDGRPRKTLRYWVTL